MPIVTDLQPGLRRLNPAPGDPLAPLRRALRMHPLDPLCQP